MNGSYWFSNFQCCNCVACTVIQKKKDKTYFSASLSNAVCSSCIQSTRGTSRWRREIRVKPNGTANPWSGSLLILTFNSVMQWPMCDLDKIITATFYRRRANFKIIWNIPFNDIKFRRILKFIPLGKLSTEWYNNKLLVIFFIFQKNIRAFTYQKLYFK